MVKTGSFNGLTFGKLIKTQSNVNFSPANGNDSGVPASMSHKNLS